ncbi:MAG: glycine cleavage system protein GcvH [Rhodospirillaceae bacterium]
MSALYFTEDHEWILVEDNIGTVGITDFAQKQLGDVVFIELPENDVDVEQGKEAGVVESVKAASDIYSPVSGKIVEGNETIVDQPGLVNEDAMGDGWFYKIALSDPTELDNLMDKDAYDKLVESQS